MNSLIVIKNSYDMGMNSRKINIYYHYAGSFYFSYYDWTRALVFTVKSNQYSKLLQLIKKNNIVHSSKWILVLYLYCCPV